MAFQYRVQRHGSFDHTTGSHLTPEAVVAVILDDRWQRHLDGQEPFAVLASMDGEVFRQHKNRRTYRTTLEGTGYFVKYHGPSGWREVLKNALRLRIPVVSAAPERRAITRCEAHNIPTVRMAGYGRSGWNPARIQSFLITEEITQAIELDALLRQMADESAQRSAEIRLALLRRVTRITRAFHDAGMNHRDMYLCHFLVQPHRSHAVFLIDLHRVQIRRHVPTRWLVKDLAGLLFSSFDVGLTDRECLRFVRDYWSQSLRSTLGTQRSLLRRIVRRAIRVYRNDHGTNPQLPEGLSSYA